MSRGNGVSKNDRNTLNMKIFLGKIPGVQNINQLSEHFYQAEEEWFNGIDVGDYAFVVGEGKIRLWKAINWEQKSQPYHRLNFEEIISNTGMKTNHLAALKFFKLAIDLIVKSRRSTARERKAFYLIEHDADNFTEEDLLNPETYALANNFREIVLLTDASEANVNSFDIQFYKESDKFKYITPTFSTDLGEFKDSTFKLGRGSVGKDRTIRNIQAQETNRWIATKFSIQDFYDLFFCDYKDKISYYILGSKYGDNANEDVFPDMFNKSVIATGFAGGENLNALVGNKQSAIINFLKSKGYNGRTYNCLKHFLNIKTGDKIAIKGSGNPKGKEGFLSIVGIAEVVDETDFYATDDNLGHTIKVEWLQAPIYKEFNYGGYGQTIHQLKNKKDENKINAIFYQDHEIVDETDQDTKLEECYKTVMNIAPLNQILFGPPGTGKTYHTINHALSIIGNVGLEEIKSIESNSDIEEAILSARELFKEVVIHKGTCKNGRDVIRAIYIYYKKKEQICFTTFHQSMSYEDFVEGIKPIKPKDKKDPVQYDVVKGIFRHISDLAESNYENAKKENRDKPAFELIFEQFKNDWEVKPEMKFSLRSEGYDFTIYEITENSIRFEKASGGRAHTLSITTLKDLYYGKKIKALHGVWIYYSSVLSKLNSYYSHVNQINKLKNYVLIIDEINRGNLSEILGELITLLEKDKRLGSKESLEVKLPYSKDTFGVPSNLYLIGTMNTADRSVEALDTALRRRFSFIEQPPKPQLLEGKEVEGIQLDKLLECINKRIGKLLTKDHLIGHSYLMDIENEEGLKSAFRNKILPLLQEYFYGDFGKIGLVLGKGFIEKEEDEVDFADFDYDSGGFESRDTFKISEIDAEFDILEAIRYLINPTSSDDA